MGVITEIKTVDYESCIPDNSFFVRWLNPIGGFDSWLFGTRQVHEYNVKDKDTFEPVINYLQLANGIQQTTGKEAIEFITVGYEGLTLDKVNGLKHIVTSPLIYWISGTPGSNDFQQLIIGVETGSYKLYDNGDWLHNMEITFIKPKLQTQSV